MHGSAAPQNDPRLDVHAVDVAEYILRHRGPMDAMKLQKLCYYAQAWSLAWGRGCMFPEDIEAWENGPVIREVFRRHKGRYTVQTVGGDAEVIDRDAVRQSTLSGVLDFYADRTGQQLSDLTHVEDPWAITRARANAAPGSHCDEVIPAGLMAGYYRSLMQHATEQNHQELIEA